MHLLKHLISPPPKRYCSRSTKRLAFWSFSSPHCEFYGLPHSRNQRRCKARDLPGRSRSLAALRLARLGASQRLDPQCCDDRICAYLAAVWSKPAVRSQIRKSGTPFRQLAFVLDKSDDGIRRAPHRRSVTASIHRQRRHAQTQVFRLNRRAQPSPSRKVYHSTCDCHCYLRSHWLWRRCHPAGGGSGRRPRINA